MERIVIIGSGIAGHSALEALIEAKNAHTQITLITEEMGSLYSPCAFPYYLAGEFPRRNIYLKHLRDYKAFSVVWKTGARVEGLDLKNQWVHLQKRSIPYDRLVLATGSEAILPSIPGIEKRGVFVLKKLVDLDRIRRATGKKVAVIGAGLIGVEAAMALRQRGWKVFLFEILDQVLPQLLDSDMAKKVEAILVSKGIRVYLKERVLEIKGKMRVQGVKAEKSEVSADIVILATGMKPRSGLAKYSGIKIGPLGGTWVDNRMETSSKNIFACGDCVESRDPIFGEPLLSLFWYVARAQGKIAGKNAMGRSVSFEGLHRIVATELFGESIYSIGYTEKELTKKGLSPQIWQRDIRTGAIRLLVWKDRLVGAQLLNATNILPHLFGGIQYGVLLNDASFVQPEKSLFSPYPTVWILQRLGIRL
jgi:NADH oxidase (H2O2-forming)